MIVMFSSSDSDWILASSDSAEKCQPVSASSSVALDISRAFSRANAMSGPDSPVTTSSASG